MARYRFSSAQKTAGFEAAPDRDVPQFAGLCKSGLNNGFRGESDPDVWKIVDGTLYLFSTAERMPADAQAPETVARAKHNWDKKK